MIREANESDVPRLAAVKPTAAMHRDRIAAASSGHLKYLVAELGGEVVGFGLLVLEQPAGWPPVTPRPQLLDLLVSPAYRGQGVGSALVGAAEAVLLRMDRRELYISVEPQGNARAFELYRRLGFTPLQDEPYESRWSFTDSAGHVHSGVEWCIDLHKVLTTERQHA